MGTAQEEPKGKEKWNRRWTQMNADRRIVIAKGDVYHKVHQVAKQVAHFVIPLVAKIRHATPLTQRLLTPYTLHLVLPLSAPPSVSLFGEWFVPDKYRSLLSCG
jgi:hypothetical protein